MTDDTPTILGVMADPACFADTYGDTSWDPWRAFLAALFGLPMTEAQLQTYRECTGRTVPPDKPSRVTTLLCGRRAGKSKIAALLAVFLAVWRHWPNLTRGEQGVIMIVACDKGQASVILDYIAALFEAAPLKEMIVRRTRESLSLANGISIECRALSFRSIRGVTVLAALLDEICMWRSDESAVPDIEIVRSIRPAMLTVPGAMLLALSSPYGKSGWAYKQFRDYYGRDDAPLVWRAATMTMNATIPAEELAAIRAEDPAAAVSELDAEFRADVSALFDPDLVSGLARSSPLEIERRSNVRYSAFVDPSGGRHDRFAAAIAHTEKNGEAGRVVVDVVRTWAAPFEPTTVVAEVAALLKSYGLRSCTGDNYSGQWVSEAFKAHSVEYHMSAMNKSSIYLECVPVFAQGRIELPDLALLLSELGQLERRTARGGRDSVDHPRGGHDDAANAVCGAINLAEKAATDPLGPDVVRGMVECFAQQLRDGARTSTYSSPGSVLSYGSRDRSPFPFTPWIK